MFGVSPGLTPDWLRRASDSALPLLPGVMTPSDVIAARAAGFTELKLFPAQQAGGIGMLKALAGPFPDVAFCPTGGVSRRPRPTFWRCPMWPASADRGSRRASSSMPATGARSRSSLARPPPSAPADGDGARSADPGRTGSCERVPPRLASGQRGAVRSRGDRTSGWTSPSPRLGYSRESTIDAAITDTITPSDQLDRQLAAGDAVEPHHLEPDEDQHDGQPVPQQVELVDGAASRKYSDRRPRIAKMFEVNTMSGSRVSAKIAGTESTANTMSVTSRHEQGDEQRGRVAAGRPAHEEALAVQLVVTGNRRRNEPDQRVALGVDRLLRARRASCRPVTMRKAPNSYDHPVELHEDRAQGDEEARKTSAPRMP